MLGSLEVVGIGRAALGSLVDRAESEAPGSLVDGTKSEVLGSLVVGGIGRKVLNSLAK